MLPGYTRFICLIAAVLTAIPACAQFSVAGRNVQIHGFFSQGYLKSDRNNYLTMRTTDGSFAMTDGGLNASLSLTDKLRVGVQGYSRNIGHLGDGRVELDWAFADFRMRDWFGIRAGKVKTPFGLYNDTQDMEFLHTWALLPQAVYPTDLRSATIAHVGADVYGDVLLRRAGTLSYVAYTGKMPDDPRGGFTFGLREAGMPPLRPLRAWSTGFDLRWTTPIEGLVAGGSWMRSSVDGKHMFAALQLPFEFRSKSNYTFHLYSELTRGNLRLAAEMRENHLSLTYSGLPLPDVSSKSPGWYASAAYRIHKRLEFGSYFGQFRPNTKVRVVDAASKRQNDLALTARVDVTRSWNLKVEGHVMDGYGDRQGHGFYPGSNPGGFHSRTNLLVLRTGVNF